MLEGPAELFFFSLNGRHSLTEKKEGRMENRKKKLFIELGRAGLGRKEPWRNKSRAPAADGQLFFFFFPFFSPIQLLIQSNAIIDFLARQLFTKFSVLFGILSNCGIYFFFSNNNKRKLFFSSWNSFLLLHRVTKSTARWQLYR